MTNEQTHTPGPWKYDSSPLGGYRVIHDPFGDGAWVQIPRENEANARLIAAAPDLLAAAKDALDRLNGMTGVPNPVPTLQDAIAKAEGQ